MESIEQTFFRRFRPDFPKLLAFGFQQTGADYRYRASFCNGDFYAELTVSPDGTVHGKVFDADTDYEYLPIRNRFQTGSFVGHVREAYEELLQQIADAAFTPVPFSFDQSNRIASRIRLAYGVLPEFPWDDDNANAIFRHTDNDKWFGALLTVKQSKLKHSPSPAASTPAGSQAKAVAAGSQARTIAAASAHAGSQVKAAAGSAHAGSQVKVPADSAPPDSFVEVLNLKAPADQIPELTTHPGIYQAWHMNKKHWISVLLNDTLTDDSVWELIEISYHLTLTGKSGRQAAAAKDGRRAARPAAWLIPAAPAQYDVAAGFAGGRTIWWHQHTDVYAGDEVYIYYGRPYSAIMFRCKVLAASVPPERTGLDPSELRPEHRKFMELALLESYPPDRFPLPFLRAHGGSVCRSARRMPAELLAAIRS